MKNNVQEPIKDAEVKPFFDKSKQRIDVDEQKSQLQEQKLFDQELESVILKDPKGAELQKLVEMGYLNLQEDVIAEYIGEKGREYKNGVIIIDKDVLSKIHLKCLATISKQLGADRPLNVKDIEQIASKEDYQERAKYIENESHSNERKTEIEKKTDNQTLNTDNKLNNEKIDKVCKDLNILGKEYLNTNDIQSMLKGLGLNSDISKYKNKTFDTFMSLQDTNILEFLAQASILKNNDQQEELDKFVKDSEFGLGVNADSKFYKEIIGEDGKIDIEKGLKFWEKYKVDREYAVLNNDIFKYMSSSVKLGKKLAMLLLRGTLIDDKDTQEKLKSIAKGMDVFDKDGNFDKEKLYAYVEKKFGIHSAEELLKRNTYINDEAALKFTSRIKSNEIKKMQEERIDNLEKLKDADDIQQYRQNEASHNIRICSKKEQKIYEVLNSLNAGNTDKMKNFFDNPENAKQVVLLFCQFRKKELGRDITSNDINTFDDSDTSAIIAKYMMEHSQYFGDYFQEIDVLKSDEIAEIGNNMDLTLSAGQATRVLNMYDAINLGIKSIEDVERKYLKSIDKVNEFLNQENGSIENENQIYELSKMMPISAFSTEMLEKLKARNEKKFSEAFKNKKVERDVGKDSLGSIGQSAARLFTKGIYTLPRMIIDKETRAEYMPKIKNHIKNGAKRLSNILTTNKDNEDNLLGKFVKSLKSGKIEKLPSGRDDKNMNTFDKEIVSQEQQSEVQNRNKKTTPNKEKSAQGNNLDYVKVDNTDGNIEAGARKFGEERQQNESSTGEIADKSKKEFIDNGEGR